MTKPNFTRRRQRCHRGCLLKQLVRSGQYKLVKESNLPAATSSSHTSSESFKADLENGLENLVWFINTCSELETKSVEQEKEPMNEANRLEERMSLHMLAMKERQELVKKATQDWAKEFRLMQNIREELVLNNEKLAMNRVNATKRNEMYFKTMKEIAAYLQKITCQEAEEEVKKAVNLHY